MIICARCQREAASVYRHLTICVPCNAALTKQGLTYCNGCQQAVKPLDLAQQWQCKDCRNAKARARYAVNEALAERKRIKSAAWRERNPGNAAAYMRHWHQRHPDYHLAYQRKIRQQENARRRQRYATDLVYRQRIQNRKKVSQ